MMKKKNHNELTQSEINTYKINLEDDLKKINNTDEIERLKEERQAAFKAIAVEKRKGARITLTA